MNCRIRVRKLEQALRPPRLTKEPYSCATPTRARWKSRRKGWKNEEEVSDRCSGAKRQRGERVSETQSTVARKQCARGCKALAGSMGEPDAASAFPSWSAQA